MPTMCIRKELNHEANLKHILALRIKTNTTSGCMDEQYFKYVRI